MRLKIFTLLSCLFLGCNLFAQELNAYKYIIIPKKYDFQKVEDKFQLNSLTRFLFNKKGFTTLFEGEQQPDDLYNNPCLGLKAKVLESSNLFSTKLAIQLLDCRNTTVYTTEEGKSKIKDLKKGHHDALRKAFQSIQELDYKFDKNLISKALPASTSKKPEPQVAKNEKGTPHKKEEVQEAVKEMQNELKEEVKDVPFAILEDSSKNILYAQKINNGFQLVDSTPKIVFKAFKSLNDENVYYLENQAGVLYKKDDVWYAEYYKDGVPVIEKLNIKF